MQIREQIVLAPYTTFGIGGPARWFAEAETETDIAEAVCFAKERQVPLFVLGGGSNLLVADEEFPGLVLHIGLKGVEQEGDTFHAAAGEEWDAFVSLAVDRGYGGIECLAGIPGTVGGTPVQNVGAYGQEVSGTIRSVRVLDRKTLKFSELPASACGFAYRRSIFNSTHRNRFIVTRVSYRLRPHANPLLSYADLRQHFKDYRQTPSLHEAAAAVREIRHRKGMLLVDGEADCRSAGSFFKNPVVPEALCQEIAEKAVGPAPRYPAEHGMVKIPAAWLLEQAGFRKGFALGPVGISSRHTLALINRGGATARDVAALRDLIVATVQKKYGIQLEPEPVWLGPGA